MAIYEELTDLIVRGRVKEIKAKVHEALDSGLGALDILNNGLLPGINIVGDRFSRNEVFVPEVLIAAKTMSFGVDEISPLLAGQEQQSLGTVVIGTVKGDLHDIGKNLVVLMMRSAGLTVHDLGANVSAEQFVAAVKEHHPNIVGLSALLTTTMVEQGNVIEALKTAGVRDTVKVMVGGAPVTPQWAEKIGADAYTADAAEASRWAKALMTA